MKERKKERKYSKTQSKVLCVKTILINQNFRENENRLQTMATSQITQKLNERRSTFWENIIYRQARTFIFFIRFSILTALTVIASIHLLFFVFLHSFIHPFSAILIQKCLFCFTIHIHLILAQHRVQTC